MPQQKLPEPRQRVRNMNAATDIERSALFARRLLDIEAERHGVGAELAKARVARREGVPASTLDNIVRGRVKQVAAWVRDRLAQAVVREIQNEISRLEHEIQIARISADQPRDADLLAAEAALAQARQLISRDGIENPAGGRRG
jgi:predicted nucleic acid-binding protein